MIHHISIDAHNPLQVASALAEIWHSKAYKFLAPGSYLVMPFDPHGTHIVVLQKDDGWIPGSDAESALIRQNQPSNFVSMHAAISVPTPPEQIEQIGQREGWRVLTRLQGANAPFSVIEFWVENRILFEFLPSEFVHQYLQTMQPEAIAQILGQPIEPVLV
jgi:hypothetical protein